MAPADRLQEFLQQATLPMPGNLRKGVCKQPQVRVAEGPATTLLEKLRAGFQKIRCGVDVGAARDDRLFRTGREPITRSFPRRVTDA